MVQEVTLNCVCDHAILCVVRRDGEYLGSFAFFDDEPTSEAYGERCWDCPGCGQHLGLLVFLRTDLARRPAASEERGSVHYLARERPEPLEPRDPAKR
jgi:hypothetical protein